jgi:hypothetical protein
MKKVLFVLMTLVAAMGIAQTPPDAPVPPVGALCDLGNNVAASVLVPYFEVDSADMAGMDTLVGLVNVDDDPIVAHVVVWNVDSWGVFDFNIYLTGYDVVTFSMRQILIYGNMPNNGCATSSSRFTTRYIDCSGNGQYFDNAWTLNDGLFSVTGYAMDIACYDTISASTLADWQCKLSIGSYDGWNANYVGYITIDNTVTCNGGMQDGSLRYFQTNYIDTDNDAGNVPDHGVLENSNVMFGDIFYYDNANMQSDGVPLVHVEAFGEANALAGHTWGMLPASFAALGINTFYYKFESGVFPPNDAREQLPLWWGFRYIGNAAFNGGTWVDVWRSHNAIFDHWFVGGGPCVWGGIGSAYTVLYNLFDGTLGLPRPALIVFDEEENTAQTGGGPSPPPPVAGFDLLYLETQRVEVSSADWPLVAESGWIAVAFDTDQYYTGAGFDNAFDQSWVNVRYSAIDKYTVGLSAGAYLNGCGLVWDGVGAFAPVATH